MKTRDRFASVCGNVLEWYDFGLFLYLAPILADHFFPPSQSFGHVFTVFMVFSAGFVMRPLGALLFGHVGDRWGRAWALQCAILSISVLAFLVAITPDYQHIGITASLCVLVLRLLQGLCLGGEFAGSMVYLAESAPQQKKAYFSSLANSGSNIGLLLATVSILGFSHGLGETAFNAWGFRCLFLLAAGLGLIGLILRLSFSETDAFLQIQSQQKSVAIPIKHLWQHHRSIFLRACLLCVLTTVGCYAFMNLLSNTLHEALNRPLEEAMRLQSLFLISSLILIPLAGTLSDRLGKEKILWIAILGYGFFSIPCYYYLFVYNNVLALIPILIFFCCEQGSMPHVLASLFPVEIRYTAVSFSYNLTVAIVVGAMPFINTFLMKQAPWLLALDLVCAACLVAMVLRRLSSRGKTIEVFA